MAREEIIAHLRQIESLVREQRYELALALTTKVEDAIACLPPEEATATRPVRDLLQASRLMTETLIRLRELRVH